MRRSPLPDLSIDVVHSNTRRICPTTAQQPTTKEDHNFGISSFSKRRAHTRQPYFLERFSLAQRHSRSFNQLQRHATAAPPSPARPSLPTTPRSARTAARASLSLAAAHSSYHSHKQHSSGRAASLMSPFSLAKCLPRTPSVLEEPPLQDQQQQQQPPKLATFTPPNPLVGQSRIDDEKRAELCPWETISPTPANLRMSKRHLSLNIKSTDKKTAKKGRDRWRSSAPGIWFDKHEHKLNALVSFLIFTLVIANLLALDISFISSSSTKNTSNADDDDVRLCTSLWNVVAPVDPASYPCSTCSLVLTSSSSSSSSSSSASSKANSESIAAIVDFCTATSDGSTRLVPTNTRS